jgi:lysophospholipase L1-like esterase
MIKKIYLLLALIFIGIAVQAQPFMNEIKAFRSADSAHRTPAHPVVLIGSSSFTKWQDVSNYFPNNVILNRGFGGSTLSHLIQYADDIVLKYHPKQVIIYCGENDFAEGPQITADTVFNRFFRLFSIIRNKFHKVPIAYISMKPSPSRTKLLDQFKVCNAKIETFMKTQKKAQFINVYTPMLNADGTMKPEIYRADSLHMNSKGYEIWQKVIQPYLVK